MKCEHGVFELDKAELRALLEFACADAGRESIHQVHFVPERGEAVTTDGKTLLVLGLTEPANCTAQPFGLGAGTLKYLLKGMAQNDFLHIGWHDSGEELVVGGSGVPTAMRFEPVAEVFLDYQLAIPEWSDAPRELAPVAFQARNLLRVEMVQKAVGAFVTRCLFGAGEIDPSVFRCERGGTAATVVLMPVRNRGRVE